MKTNKENKKEIARNSYMKAIENKRAINKCIREGGDLKKLINDRNIKFATPL